LVGTFHSRAKPSGSYPVVNTNDGSRQAELYLWRKMDGRLQSSYIGQGSIQSVAVI